jgi:hypothetical protein
VKFIYEHCDSYDVNVWSICCVLRLWFLLFSYLFHVHASWYIEIFLYNISLICETTYSWGLGFSKEGVMFDIPSHVVFHPSINAKEPSLVVYAFCSCYMVSTIIFFNFFYFSQFVIFLKKIFIHGTFVFFSDTTFGSDIYNHYIHYYSDYFDINYRFSICILCIFALEHFLHPYKFWIVYHLVSIQTTYRTCILYSLLNFLIMSSSFCRCYSWLLFLLHSTRVYIVIISTTICVVLANLSCFCLWFQCCCSFVDLWY